MIIPFHREVILVTILTYSGGTGGVGKNLPLRHERFRWKSDMPLSEKQVHCKRDEFWDTAPAFEGRWVSTEMATLLACTTAAV